MILAALMAVMSLSANAQFEYGTMYGNLSLSSFDMSYRKDTKFHFGLEAMGGSFVEDAWMVNGRFGYDHQGRGEMNNFELGAGFRYYFVQNGIFLGGGVKYEFNGIGSFHRNYLDLTPEVGYFFYLNRNLSIEPVVYYDLCVNKFSDGSRIGLKLGFGYYF